MKSRLPLLKLILGFLLGLLLIGALGLTGAGAYNLSRQLTLGGPLSLGLGPDLVTSTPTPLLNAQGTPLPTPDSASQAALPTTAATLTPWDGTNRVTFLLLGLDYRDWASNEGASRSDTMILLTLDPLTRSAGILSIPRDLWVSIPGFQHGKINTAYYLGDAYKMPGGGPGLAVKTVEQFLGIPINYYAQVDFGAFVRFIDEIGGVKIDVPAEITIDMLGDGPQTKKTLKPGKQVLPGEWALAYARNRKTEGGDFDRAERQQQVILGIRDRILRFDMLPTLVTKAPTLYKELASGVNTNLSLDEMIKLAVLAQTIPDENIRRGVIGKQQVVFGFSPDNLSILIPLPDKIYTLRAEIFDAAGSFGPALEGDALQRMQKEAARVALYNGTQDPALLAQAEAYLRSQGVNIVQTGQADQAYTVTTVIDHSGSPYALQYLVDLLDISRFKVLMKYDPESPVDVELYIGKDLSAGIPKPSQDSPP